MWEAELLEKGNNVYTEEEEEIVIVNFEGMLSNTRINKN